MALGSFLIIFAGSCAAKKKNRTVVETIEETTNNKEYEPVEVEKKIDFKLGIERMDLFLDSLSGERVAVVGNQTSIIHDIHLVDTLLSHNINVIRVFSPEHGFRGKKSAGVEVNSSVDSLTGLSIVSLYGNNKKPTVEQIQDLDVIIFDIQDVGVRFYTYISTLHYVMEACAENGKKLIVLDRPNPNGHYVDGPTLKEGFHSFIGMHPVPVVHGMTIGEYALMINGEGWLKDSMHCDLQVVKMRDYYHSMKYSLPVPPSPNLRSDIAIALYPSLCFFEGTSVSIGRGTDRPFEVYGHPNFEDGDYSFTPLDMEGAKNPKLEGQLCVGFDLRGTYRKRPQKLNLNYLFNAKDLLGDTKLITDPRFFALLAGTDELAKQIEEGWSIQDIRDTWIPDLEAYKKIRKKYLLYPE